jgi:hypothetical protein
MTKMVKQQHKATATQLLNINSRQQREKIQNGKTWKPVEDEKIGSNILEQSGLFFPLTAPLLLHVAS